MKQLLCILLVMVFQPSCVVFHSGSVSSGPLLNSNDTYIKIASGNEKTVHILGLGSLGKNELVQKAKTDMYYKFPLKKNEYYANFTTDINKKIIFGIVTVIKATVSADVLLTNTVSSSPFSVGFSHSVTPYVELSRADVALDTSKYNGRELMNGDTVFYTYKNMPYQQYVVSSLDKESVILNAAGKDYPTILVSLKLNTFYIKNRSAGNLKCGEEVKIEVIDSFDNNKQKTFAVVCGFCNNTHVLLKSYHDYHSVTLNKIFH